MRGIFGAAVLMAGCAAGDGGGGQAGDPAGARDVRRDDGTLTTVEGEPALPFLEGFGWPVSTPATVRSGFGPRRLGSEGGRDDFHLGVDIAGDAGDPVLAVADGVVTGLVFDAESTSGTLLVVEHVLAAPVDWAGRTHDKLYAVYAHMRSVDVAEGDAVTAGQVLGGMGAEGDADGPHLHFEARLGTWCTQRWRTENPESTCGWDGYDPQINPFHLLDGSAPGGATIAVVGQDPLVLRVRTPSDDLDLDRVATELGAIGFDAREGLDASTWDALDDFDYGWARVEPASFGDEARWMEWTLTFPTAPAWLEATDIHGDGARWEP